MSNLLIAWCGEGEDLGSSSCISMLDEVGTGSDGSVSTSGIFRYHAISARFLGGIEL